MADAAANPEECDEHIRNYLYRTGIDHLLDAGREEAVKELLLDFRHLARMIQLGKTNWDIISWLKGCCVKC